ncbi:undecaprenyl-phosphate glucose phosphotransferase [Endozoicomonas numazuensis]|uniref:undecaprenyl-phosphate glucose phosphotransferase n=1 Tax=Endozoicomonas numazuensis TaxID=1137799 RepID=UPI0009DCF187|nr:undecaprenyl-phosphate glucose phosphotransferase [Endozoicomonas numazuensis]
MYDSSDRRSLCVLLLFVLSDLFIALASGWFAYLMRFGDLNLPESYQTLIIIFSLLAVVSFGVFGPNSSWHRYPWLEQIRKLSTAFVMAFSGLLLILVAFKMSHEYSRVWLSIWMLTHATLAVLFYSMVSVAVKRYWAREENTRSVLIIGKGAGFKKTVDRFLKPNSEGYLIKDTIYFENLEDALGQLQNRINEGQQFDAYWIFLPLNCSDAVKDIVHTLRHETGDIQYMPGLSELPLINHQVTTIGDIYSFDITRSPLDGFNSILKRAEDIVIASLILILISPLCLLIALAVKLSSPGPVLFKQYRYGKGKEKIKVYKFRSMKLHQEESGSVTQAIKGDPRITRLGAFLRCTSLDELPQFINVLQGRMSIVGPRPHAVAHNEQYKDQVASYMKRHKIKPGITGLAQVNGYRGETDTLEKMQKRVEFDIKYLEQWSLWLDIKIVFKTVFKGFISDKAY